MDARSTVAEFRCRAWLLSLSLIPSGRPQGLPPPPLASLLVRPPLASFAFSGLLGLGALGFGLCSFSYGKWASEAPSSQEAAAHALPFLLFSTSGAASLLLSGSALADGLAQRSQRRSRLS